MPFSVVRARRTCGPIAHRKCYFLPACVGYVQWTSNIYASVVFRRVGGVPNVFALVYSLLWKAKS